MRLPGELCTVLHVEKLDIMLVLVKDYIIEYAIQHYSIRCITGACRKCSIGGVMLQGYIILYLHLQGYIVLFP
jgi:hypothetical protein